MPQSLTKLTEEEFLALKPAGKKSYFERVLWFANEARRGASIERSGKTQGSAFLWLSVYGKSGIARAFRSFIKKRGCGSLLRDGRFYADYRQTKHAWYFGSQQDLGVYDGLKAMASTLTEFGIDCYLCDEWD